MRAFRSLNPLTMLFLALLVFATATGAVDGVNHAALDAPIQAVDADLDGDVAVGPVLPVQLVSSSEPTRLVAAEPRRPTGRTEAPPDRPPTHAA